MDNWTFEIENDHGSGVYAKRDLTIVRGAGARLWDSAGNEYIDCTAGIGVANIGHANPALSAAIKLQADTLITCPEMFYNDKRAKLLDKLTSITGFPRVFLCNSGTEANEACLKFSRIATGRSGHIAAMRGFHGRTMGSLSATWEKRYREPFEPLIPGFKHVPYNNLEALEKAIDETTASVTLEVVQGEGGVNLADPEYLRAAQQLCRERGAMLILDEVQTGFGRTGYFLAHQRYGLEPDLVCMAKSLAGGIPMGAALIGERVGAIPSQTHGSTFGGNPLACAASLAAIQYLEDHRLAQRAEEVGTWFVGELRKIESPLIREVRGLGLLVGIELKHKATPYLQALTAERVLALPAGMTVMRFLPPLVIDQSDLVTVVEKVNKVLNAA